MWTGGARALIVAVIAATTVGASQPATGATVVGGSAAQREMARWAVGRFGAEGFTLPRVQIQFHPGQDGCRGRMGYYHDGVTDLCYVHTSLTAARTLLHEMAHGWLEANLSGGERRRFLELRGLRSWNDSDVVWDERGFEQAAEIIAWALGDQGDGIHMPSIPDNSHVQLVEAYELLTGLPFPTLRAGMAWRGE